MSFSPGSKIWIDGPVKRAVTLGALLKSGGAGSVFLIHEMPTLVAKIYHRDLSLAVYERKLKAMLLLTPNLPEIHEAGNRFVQIAWPQSILRDDRGSFIGFTMPLLDIKATSELEYIMQERQARAEGLPIGLGTKITLAANLSAVIAELHRQHHYVVDMKPVNLRFYRQSLYMAMLDCDGFSIQGQGERFEAPQFTPDYLAPEFQVKGIDAAGEEHQDRFALAVVIFQLLNFGIHPFTGKPNSDHVPTDIPGRIAARCYAYGLKPHKSITPSMVSGHEAISARLRYLFDRAFESHGKSRPSAIEWADALKDYAQKSTGKLVVCKTDREHQHFAESECAACARDALLKKARQAVRSPSGVRKRPSLQKATANRRSLGRPRVPTPLPGRKRPIITPKPLVIAKSTPYPFNKYVPIYTPPQNPLIRPISGMTFYGVPLAIVFGLIFLIGRVHSCSALNGENEESRRVEADQAAYQIAAEEWRRNNLKKVEEVQFVAAPNLAETGRLANEAASAIAVGDIESGNESLAILIRVANEHRPPLPSSADRHNQVKVEYLSSRDMSPEAIEKRQKNLIEQYSTILSLDPLAAQTSEELGWVYVMNREMLDAKNCFFQTLWAQPENAAAWYGIGVTEMGSGSDDTVVGMFAIAEIFLNQEPSDTASKLKKNQERGIDSRSLQSRIEFLQYQLSPAEKKKFTVLRVRAQQLVDEVLGKRAAFGTNNPTATSESETRK